MSNIPSTVRMNINDEHCPSILRDAMLKLGYSELWSLGNLDILSRRLLALVCSTKCPGDAILEIFDMARVLRDAGIPVISGFHSPMNKECLDLILRGSQPIVICPARNILNMRIPGKWRKPLKEKRLLILSPFPEKDRRITADLAEKRNRFVAFVSNSVLVAYAAPGSKTEHLARELLIVGKPLHMIDCSSTNKNLEKDGAIMVNVDRLNRDDSYRATSISLLL